MTIQYGLTLDNQNLIINKAKTKADGIYRFRGVVYRVEDNKAVLFYTKNEILQCYCGFNSVIRGGVNEAEAIKLMKSAKL